MLLVIHHKHSQEKYLGRIVMELHATPKWIIPQECGGCS